MAKKDRKYVLRPSEVKWEQLPDLPHHHGGWGVRDMVRKAQLSDIPLQRLPVDVIEMNVPRGGWQETGIHKTRWHVNWIESGRGLFTIDGEKYPVRKGAVVIIPANTPHAVRNTGNVPLVMFAVHVSPAQTTQERKLGTQAWKPPKK